MVFNTIEKKTVTNNVTNLLTRNDMTKGLTMSLQNIENTIITQLIPHDKTQDPRMVACEVMDPSERVVDAGGICAKFVDGGWMQKVAEGWVKIRHLGELVHDPAIFS